MGLLLELQKRIPDRWFLRRLLPSTFFVVVAVVGGGQLGQRHWADVGLARERIASGLRPDTATAPGAIASLVLIAVAVTACALVVPLVARVAGTLASGAWPWWLMPLGRRITAVRVRRWVPPDEIGKQAVRARADGRRYRADRLDARRARTASAAPQGPTWSGDRLRAVEARVTEQTGLDLVAEWTKVLLVVPDTARARLSDARDAYDAACEALVWGAALILVAVWWWPAAPAGLMISVTGWRWLRHAVHNLGQTAEAVFALYRADQTIGL